MKSQSQAESYSFLDDPRPLKRIADYPALGIVGETVFMEILKTEGRSLPIEFVKWDRSLDAGSQSVTLEGGTKVTRAEIFNKGSVSPVFCALYPDDVCYVVTVIFYLGENDNGTFYPNSAQVVLTCDGGSRVFPIRIQWFNRCSKFLVTLESGKKENVI